MDKEQIIKEILEEEWFCFTNLENTGGRASCQDNKEEFLIMRSSQWEDLSRDVCYSYLRDLYNAFDNGRNLLFEKYAYMMEFTHKEEFLKLTSYLPRVDVMNEKVIEKITDIVMKWEEEFYAKYPKISKYVRSLDEAIPGDIAPAKAYLIGEHKTYSYTTNLVYLGYIRELEYNLVERIYADIINKKGLGTLEELERKL